MKVSYSGKRPSQSERRGMRKSLREQTCCSAPAGGAFDQCVVVLQGFCLHNTDTHSFEENRKS